MDRANHRVLAAIENIDTSQIDAEDQSNAKPTHSSAFTSTLPAFDSEGFLEDDDGSVDLPRLSPQVPFCTGPNIGPLHVSHMVSRLISSNVHDQF